MFIKCTEFNSIFDSAIKQINDAKAHWMINPNMTLMELRLAKYDIDNIIKLIKE